MSNLMAVLLNGIAQLEYDRGRVLPNDQKAYLDRMDQKMDGGITLGGEQIAMPDQRQRAQFVATSLHAAMRADNEGLSSALCSYLAVRLPDLHQVRIDERDGEVLVDLVFDEPYGKQVAVSLTKMH